MSDVLAPPGGAELARIVLESATDFVILTTDPDGVVTSWNPGAEKLLGWSADEMIGRDGRIIFTPEDRERREPEHEMETARREGRAEDTRWHMREDGSRFWASGLLMTLKEGAPGFVKILRDETERREIEIALDESEARLSFMSGLDEALRDSRDAPAAMLAAAELLARRLGASRTAYADVDADGDRFFIRDDYTAPGVASSAGDYSLDLFGPRAAADMRGGRTLVVRDVAGELGPGEGRETFLSIGVAAIVCCPLVKNGRLVAMMAVHQDAPRDWRDDEVALVETVVERCWAHVERVGAEARLRESEQRFRNMADHAPVMMWVTDPEGRCTYLNRAWYDFTGQSHAEAEGFGWLDAVHPDDRGWSGETFLAANARREAFRLEYRLRRSDGVYRWTIDAASPRFGQDGEFLGFIGSVIDIDDRREAEERLRESEARYRTLFEAVDAGFCVLEMKFDDADRPIDYRLVEINPAFERQTGLYGAAGKWVSEAVPGLERHWFEIYGRVALTGEPVRFENHAEPMGRWFDVHAFRVGRTEERRVAVLFNDITERRNAEERLRELNETLEDEVAQRTAERDRMWETSPDLMLVIGFDGYIRRVNPAWTTLLGYAPEELVGHHVNEFVLPGDHAETVDAYELAASGGRPKIENRYRHKDGSTRWISWAAAPAGDMTYATGRDVTREKERQAELEAAQEQLRQAQKMEAVGQLTGGIAHDFNNLLTGVIGSLDMMQRRLARGETDKVERYATAAVTSANRAAALTHRLLAFSRRQPLDPRPVNANRLVTGMEELLRRTIGEAIRLEIVTAGGLWQTLCDPHQLESAILNLAINARDAMPEGGALTIETCNAHLDNAYAAKRRDVRPGQYVCICVTDTGVGMTPEVMEKAFEPFFTTKPIGQGTGLGLSMIYGFARQSEGYAKIYSEPGRGTTFKLYLPRHYGEGEDAEENHVELGDGLRAEDGETVLVVEDETAVRDLVVDVLEELGYRAVQAADGPAGLKLLQSDMRVDLLVTDIGLPGLNGRELADEARERRPGLKVLFMTGYAENAAVANGFLDPGMEMITKPFAIDALATRIREMIENAAGKTS